MTAKRKSTPPLTQRFHVGQRCILVLDAKSGWAPFNGEECVVTEPKRRMNIWCEDWDGGNRKFKRGEERYVVEFGDFALSVRETDLRPLYDGEQLSTWDEFAKITGLRLDRAVVQGLR